MFVYKIELYVKTEQRSMLIEVFKTLRDPSWINSKRDHDVLASIVNDNLDIEIANITKAEV